MRPCVPDRIGIWKCWFLRRGETGVPGEEPLRAKGGPSTNSTHMASTPVRIRTRAKLVEAMGHPCSPNVPLARHALSSRFRKMQNIHLEEKERTLKEDRLTFDLINIVFKYSSRYFS